MDVDVVVMTSEMTSAGNPVMHGSTSRNFGQCVRAHGSSDVEVFGGVELIG